MNKDLKKRNEADKIASYWSSRSNYPFNFSKRELKRAALLAWEGYLTSVKFMEIMNIWTIDVGDIPRDQIRKLASIVTDTVIISKIVKP